MTKLDELVSGDWEFVSDKTNFITHGIHRYSSKFIPQIPHRLIQHLSREDDVVLDPFIGSGTTLLEANRLGRHVLGIDMNPVAYLIAKVKSTPLNLDELDATISGFIERIAPQIAIVRLRFTNQSDLFNSHPQLASGPVSFPQADRWYQKKVLAELVLISDLIAELNANPDIKDFFICAFSAITRSVSNASSGYGNLMIDKKKREINNTFEIFQAQLVRMRDSIKNLNENFDDKHKCDVYQADSRNMLFIGNNSVDCIVTHPPYISAVPYAEYLRLSLVWLQEKFAARFPTDFSHLLDHKRLDEEIIGGKRNRTDVVSRFSEGMFNTFSEMYRVLKSNSYCAVVIGNPTVRGEQIRCDDLLATLAVESGFKLETSIRRGTHRTTMGKMKEEFILIFQK